MQSMRSTRKSSKIKIGFKMARLFFFAIVLLMSAMADSAPEKPKTVHCGDRKFPSCYYKQLQCPNTCPQKCVANCSSCEALCPPPPPPKPNKVKCKDKYSTCYNNEFLCPADCPKTCKADCKKCKSVCPPPPPPPRPPPIVRCKRRNSTCYNQEFLCPAECNRRCRADCVACKAVCIPPPVTQNPPPPPVSYAPAPLPIPSPPPPPGDSPAPPPGSSEAAGGKRVRCKNKSFPSCYMVEHRCPTACPDHCDVDCVTCSPTCNCNKPGAVCQDPRFVGADGVTFYFHGKKDKDFCIVSDTNLHINAHFIGRRNENMGRDFTWVQSLGILFDHHQISVGAKKTAIWDNSVDRLELSYNGQPIFLEETEGAKWDPISAPGVSITRTHDTNAVVIDVEENFQIKAVVVPITEKDSMIHKYGVTDEDCFAHLDLGFKFYSLSGEVNGVLGQTYARNYVSRAKMGVDVPVLGGEREFASSGLFSTNCSVARFRGTRMSSINSFQYANLKCASGMDGSGVVCKR